MATSVNGFIARRDGDEDFLPSENWKQMIFYIKEHGNLIWGRKTYEAVVSWGDKYVESLKNFPIIIVSKSKKAFSESNITVCSSPEEAVEIAKSKNYKKALLSGGSSLNTSFIKANLVDEIIISINPTILADGIKLFSESDFEIKLELKKVDELSSGIVQLRYSVINVIPDKSA
ncbi:dihydrofolate reductase family protein [bacterium]|nr:dihydrofolate reductase family protein [bacterium]